MLKVRHLECRPSGLIEGGQRILDNFDTVKSPTSVARLSQYMFISEGNPHLESRFCRVELGQLPILRYTVLEFELRLMQPLQNSL
jgi:hypothetical protein